MSDNMLERLEYLFDEHDTRDVVRQLLTEAWDNGARNGSRGVLTAAELAIRNPYREHAPHTCSCAFHYAAAMGGGR